jgi:hypothetical protein
MLVEMLAMPKRDIKRESGPALHLHVVVVKGVVKEVEEEESGEKEGV